MIPIILSGGSGTRLWPLSRASCPKQFINLHSDKTLFQETICRVKMLGLPDPIIMCNEDHRFIVAQNMQNIGYKAQNIIIEPLARNTAPAITAAAIISMKDSGDPILFILPSDHIIKDITALASSIKTAQKLAEQGKLVTFGIKPTYAHTGYGYIKLGENIENNANEILEFKEKPNKGTAEEFIKNGKYLWNSGMFCFKASRYLSELKKHHPDLLKHVKNSINNAKNDLDFNRLDKGDFAQCHDISIDYAIMEKTDKGVVVGLDASWSDIGSWNSVWDTQEKDKYGNVCTGDIIVENSQDSYIYSGEYSGKKLISVVGAKNLVIINMQDALLVADKNCVQDIKTIINKLKNNNRPEL